MAIDPPTQSYNTEHDTSYAMDEPTADWLREAYSFVKYAATVEPASEQFFRTLGYTIQVEYPEEEWIADARTLSEHGASASFAVLGRDAAEMGSVIDEIDSAGHEIALHGHRHEHFDRLSYDVAHDALAEGLAAIEDASGVSPRGFLAPEREISGSTLRAVADLGLDWAAGQTDDPVPDEVTLVDKVKPNDFSFFGYRETPAGEGFSELRDVAREAEDEPRAMSFHPKLLRFWEVYDEYEHWLADVQPVSVDTQLQRGGVGVVLDNTSPFRQERVRLKNGGRE